MAKAGRKSVVWFVVALFVMLVGPGRSGPTAAACGGSPMIATDKPDYGPTEIVVISGAGFNCGELLSVLVTTPDGSTRSGDGTGAAGPDSVVIDDDGAFALSYLLSGTLADGRAYQGQLGIYRVEVRDGSGMVLAETRFSDGPGVFSCALTTAGGVKCWGDGGAGQLGNGGRANSATPVDVTGLTSGVVQVAGGFLHACALTTAGAVKCWGSNSAGQLGIGTFTPGLSATPVDVSGLGNGVAQISAGDAHTCAVTTGGGAKCWGSNARGGLGNGTFTTRQATPVDVSTLTSGVKQISAGADHTCAVTTDGGAKCWGQNDSGQLGNGTVTTSAPFGSPTPGDVSTLTSGAVQISAGYSRTCAVTSDGGAKCWGSGHLGTSSATPVDVSTLTSGVAQITLGMLHTCALTAGGGVKCWGYNDSGQLGNGTFTASATPVDVTTLTSGVAMISSGWLHSCAVTTAGAAKCWGVNGRGELGNGMFTTSPPFGIATPGDVIGLTSGVAALWDGEPIVGETIPPTYYEIVARNSDKCLDVTYGSTGAAVSVIQWICHGGANQQWRLEPAGGGAVRIIARHSGQVLDVCGALLDDVTPIIQWPAHGGDNQAWTLDPASNGYVFIVARHSGKVLDVEFASMDDGARVIQYTVHGGANQQWLLRAVAPN